tara:strand:- start:37 stop:1122 length:1086 start_codon:yes stop_codon:yes gene_type:complete
MKLTDIEQFKQIRKRFNRRDFKKRLTELELFTEVIPDGVVLLDEGYLIVAANDSAQRLLGLPDSAIGEPFEEHVKVPRLRNYMRSESANKEPLEFTSPIQKDSVLESRVFDVDPRSRAMIIRDITTLNRLLTMRQSFVANVSHELRTPLTVVKGYLEAMTDPESSDDLRLGLIEKLVAPVDRMESLVQDLLLLTRLESNPVPPDMHEVDMASLIRNANHEVQGLLRKKDTLTVDCKTDTKIFGLPTELHSVCVNLISNAIRYSPDGANIVVSWEDAGDNKARLSVKDHGLGIAKEHLDRITERFYRVDMQESRGRGGTGLGLAIVKHVLRRHNSELKVRSEINHGSLFFCEFEAIEGSLRR